MKFEEFLMQPSEGRRRRLALQEEVEELQERLDGELRLNNVLRNAIKGPILSSQCLSPELPLEVQALLTELEIVEEEIIWLERKVKKLKQSLNHEKKLAEETKQLEKDNKTSVFDLELYLTSPRSHGIGRATSSRYTTLLEERRRLCLSSVVSDSQSFSSNRFNEDKVDRSQRNTESIRSSSETGISSEDPNKISEELLRSLISIFVKMSKASEVETGTGSAATKHTLSCITSRTKSSFTCKARPSINHDTIQTVDPWDASAYKGYTQITRNSLSKGYTSDCNTIMRRIRVLLQKLCDVDLAFLTYKQKLAFWINVYNACIMNVLYNKISFNTSVLMCFYLCFLIWFQAYLQHGLPSTQDRMLSLMNKAALNVGGIVLNALAIEHYILRHPHDPKQDVADEKEMLLRRAYGLRYPEPNVTFALCRGNWSSPALKVYSREEVVNELEKAKIEYLEAYVGVRSKKKILVPKLLRWHMRDFADDLESLIEWIYSQLPQNGLLKRRIMECLNAEMNPIRNTVEIIPYEYEFRYLIPIQE